MHLDKQIAVSWKFIIFLISSTIFIFCSQLFPIVVNDPLSDLGNYYNFFNEINSQITWDSMFRYEPGFFIFFWICKYFLTFSETLWLIKFIVFYSFFLAVFSNFKNKLFSLIFILIFYIYFLPIVSLHSLVIRQGLAVSVLFFFLAKINDEKTSEKKMLIILFSSILFHYSAIIIIIVLVLMNLKKNYFPFILWICSGLIYFFNFSFYIGQYIYGLLGINIYLVNLHGVEYILGFKPLFLLISIFFIIIPIILYFIGTLNISLKDLLSLKLFRFYFILNSLCMYTSFMPYYDRYFLWSWAIGPVLLSLSFKYIKYKIKKDKKCY